MAQDFRMLNASEQMAHYVFDDVTRLQKAFFEGIHAHNEMLPSRFPPNNTAEEGASQPGNCPLSYSDRMTRVTACLLRWLITHYTEWRGM